MGLRRHASPVYPDTSALAHDDEAEANAPSAAEFLRALLKQRLALYKQKEEVTGCEKNSSLSQQDGVRMRLSEQHCLKAHLEALDVAEGKLEESASRWTGSVELRADLKALAGAGLLGHPPSSADSSARSPQDAVAA